MSKITDIFQIKDKKYITAKYSLSAVRVRVKSVYHKTIDVS